MIGHKCPVNQNCFFNMSSWFCLELSQWGFNWVGCSSILESYWTRVSFLHNTLNRPGHSLLVRVHFTNNFSTVIQIRWKIGFSVTPLLGIISLQNFAHATTATMSCHEQNFIAITLPQLGWLQKEIPIKFELQWKNCSWMGPMARYII